MRILLVKPYNLSDHIQPSLGLGYLATACRPRNEVAIVDCIKDRLDLGRLARRIRSLKPDLVGFQCYTFDLKYIKQAIEACKAIDKGMITVAGGPHPSAVPKESFGYFGRELDFIFAGEAEVGMPLLADKLQGASNTDFSQIPGLAWRNGSEVSVNAPVFHQDLDNFGMPAWDLIRPESYPESQHGAFFKKFPIAPVMSTRGCPFLCTFCAGNIVTGRRIRKHGVDFMLKQIKYLHDAHGIREFHMVDDNFTFDKSYAKEFLKGLIGLGLEMSWSTPNGVRLDTLDEELLALMKQSGLYLISLGIESGSDRILEMMKKNTTTARIREGIKLIHKFKIEVAGFFILGFPGETRQEIKRTIDFSARLGLVRANYFTYLPFPGTASYNQLAATGEIGGVGWERFYFMNAAYVPRGMTRRELKNLQREAFLRFYLRPWIFWKNLKGIRTLKHLQFLIKRFFHWVLMS